MYFYKSSNGWVLGKTKDSLIPLAQYYLEFETPTVVDITPINSQVRLRKYNNIKVTDICKNSAGDKYASVSEFIAGVKDYFLSPIESLKGADGADGADGASAYQSYVNTTEDNPVLTEVQWVASLKGANGANGANGADGLLSTPLPYCADYTALSSALISAGIMLSS